MFTYNNGLSKEVIPKTEVIQPNHHALLVIDSKDKFTQSDGDHYNSTFLNENFNKIALSRYHIDYRLPQLIVGFNETLIISEFDAGDNFIQDININTLSDALVPDGFLYFPTLELMRQHLAQRLNSKGLTFSVVEVGPFWRIDLAGGNKFTIKEAKRLRHFGLVETVTPRVSLLVQPRLLYTRYLDLYCDQLKEGQKNKDFFSRPKTINGFFYRIFIENEGVNDKVIQNLIYNVIRPRNLNEISIRLIDEYNELAFFGNDKQFSNIDYYLEFILG